MGVYMMNKIVWMYLKGKATCVKKEYILRKAKPKIARLKGGIELKFPGVLFVSFIINISYPLPLPPPSPFTQPPNHPLPLHPFLGLPSPFQQCLRWCIDKEGWREAQKHGGREWEKTGKKKLQRKGGKETERVLWWKREREREEGRQWGRERGEAAAMDCQPVMLLTDVSLPGDDCTPHPHTHTLPCTHTHTIPMW